MYEGSFKDELEILKDNLENSTNTHSKTLIFYLFYFNFLKNILFYFN